MKQFFTLISVLGFFSFSFAQQLPNLPIPLGSGNAEVWNGSIFYFGGSNSWSGSIVYPRIYKFDGSAWAYHDSIPDNNLWDVETTRVGDYVYLLGGWPNGSSMNRRYNLTTGQWVYLTPSPNLSQSWGVTAEEVNGTIYLFNSYGDVYAYHIASDSWTTKTPNTASGSWDMSSIQFQGEIYIIGWAENDFYKFSPASDQWTKLADSPYPVGACAFGIINDQIYCIGGNTGGATGASYKSVIVYNISDNSWKTDNLELSAKRHWMATAEYLGGLYVVGGIDSISYAVGFVEEIVPQGTAGINDNNELLKGYKLGQNYPNPIINSASIEYVIPAAAFTTLKVYDLLGTEVATLVSELKYAGTHEVKFNLNNAKPGVYFYTLQSGKFIQTKKLVLQR